MRGPTRFALHQGVLLNVVFFAVIGFALFALPRIPVERYPNIDFGEVLIVTPYPGAGPEKVEQQVTREIEDGIRTMHRIEGIEFVRSVSTPDQSQVFVKFHDDADYDALYEELRLAVLARQNRLPTLDGKPLAPEFSKVDVDEWLPVIQVNLVARDSSRPLSKRALTLLAEELRTRLENVAGVKEVSLMGDEAQQFEVALDPALLRRRGVAPAEVAAALRRGGTAPPGGTVAAAGRERLVRADGRFRSRDDLLAVPVRTGAVGDLLAVGDLVDARATGVRERAEAVRFSVDGRDSVACKVQKLPHANAIDVKRACLAEVDRFLDAHAADEIDAVFTLDGTRKIREGLGVLGHSLLLAVVLVIALLFLFMTRTGRALTLVGAGLGVVAATVVALVDHRAVQLVAIAALALFVLRYCRLAVLTISGIAFSFLGSFLIFHLVGYSINEISLLSLVLVTGIVVDDAIVVLENIHRHRERGAPLRRAVIDGTAEVFLPVVSATATTMAAFLPMLLMSGSIGDFFSLIPIAVSVTLLVSLFECLFVLPVHVVDLERLFGPEREHARRAAAGTDGDRPIRPTTRIYRRCLGFALRHPVVTVGATGLAFLAAVAVVVWSFWLAPMFHAPPILKENFFPDDPAQFELYLTMPDGTPKDGTEATLREVSRRLLDEGPERIAGVTAMTGMSIDTAYRPVFDNRYGFAFIEIPERHDRAEEPTPMVRRLGEELAREFADTGARIRIKLRSGGPPTGRPVHVRVTGVDHASIDALAGDVRAFLDREAEPGGRLAGIVDLAIEGRERIAELAFAVDERRAALHGIDEAKVNAFVGAALDGTFAGELRRADDDIPVRVRLAPGAFDDPSEVASVPFAHRADGEEVRFADVGELCYRSGPRRLVRRDFRRSLSVTADIAETARIGPSVIARVVDGWYRSRAADYPGASLAFGGEAESTARSYRSLVLAFLFGICVIYAILATQFRSYVQPLLIMSNVVFSFTGVVLLMALFGLIAQVLGPAVIRPERSYFTVQSFIAIVGLTGLVINDAIVFIDFINRRRAEGMPLREAVTVAGEQRMRPILMTSLTTIAGLLPMAIGIPAFSIAWSPFATCFIAGLIMSTALTLLVLPVLYELLDRLAARTARGWRRLFPTGERGEEA